jgi:hypothetical protein
MPRGDLSRQGDNATYVKTFIEACGDAALNWNKEQIQKRAEAMAKDAYHRIWKIT